MCEKRICNLESKEMIDSVNFLLIKVFRQVRGAVGQKQGFRESPFYASCRTQQGPLGISFPGMWGGHSPLYVKSGWFPVYLSLNNG